MGLLNLTIQDASPFITYSAGWLEGTDSDAVDSFHSDYNGTFRVTQVAASQASLSFVGTSVAIFGAMRDNHGNYLVKLDDQLPFLGSGFHRPNIFNVSLWSAEGLPNGKHTVTITNMPNSTTGPFLDIDYIDIGRQIGDPTDPIFQTTLDDNSPQVTYTTGAWTTLPIATAFGNSLHRTSIAGAQMAITFRGCCLEVYGQYANANYTVVVDQQVPVGYTGLDVDLDDQHQHPQTLLYLVDGLEESTQHVVTLTNLNADDQRPLFFDYAVVSSIHNPNASSITDGQPTNQPTSQPNSKGGSSTPIGAIVGIVIGALALIIVIIILVMLYRRRSKRPQDPEKRFSAMTTATTRHRAAHIEPFMLGNTGSHEARDSTPQPPTEVNLSVTTYATQRPPEKFQMHGQSTAPRSHTTSQYTHSRYPSSVEPESTVSGFSNHTPTSPIVSSTGVSSFTRPSRSSSAENVASGSARRGERPLPTIPASPSPHVEGPAPSNKAGVQNQRVQPAIQEEDAGIVVQRADGSTAVALPPAYDPNWNPTQA